MKEHLLLVFNYMLFRSALSMVVNNQWPTHWYCNTEKFKAGYHYP